jgi:hypothetical protein
MTRSNLTRGLALLAILTLSSALAESQTHQASKTSTVEDTFTWWCVNLTDLWNAKETVVIGLGTLTGDPSFTPYCGDPSRFPITVPAGGTFMPAGAFHWATNKTYPAGYAAAVEAQGFRFSAHSQSPAEDFRSKIDRILVEVFTFPAGDPVANFTFDAQKNVKVVQLRDVLGPIPIDPIVDPALGINLSSEEVGRLPTHGFPVRAGPVPPGEYFYCLTLTISADHWTGLGVDLSLDYLPAGDFFINCNRFNVGP